LSLLGKKQGKIGMEWKVFTTVFGAIFIAEMADKTQLVTLLFTTDND